MEKQQLQVNMQGQDGLIDNGDQEVESSQGSWKSFSYEGCYGREVGKELEDRFRKENFWSWEEDKSSDKGQSELEKRISDLNLLSLEKYIEMRNLKNKANEADNKLNEKEEELNLKVKSWGKIIGRSKWIM